MCAGICMHRVHLEGVKPNEVIRVGPAFMASEKKLGQQIHNGKLTMTHKEISIRKESPQGDQPCLNLFMNYQP